MNHASTDNIGVPMTKNIDAYRKAKLKILKRDFLIPLTDEQKAHAQELKTEIAIDNFCLMMVMNHYK